MLLSETDTEVAAHLLELQVLSGVDLTTAMQRVCHQLDGAFTLVAVDARGPDPRGRRPPQLAAGRRASARARTSSAPTSSAFIEHTREALELGQDQVVTITRDGVEVTDFDGTPAEGRRYHVDWDLSAAEKDGHDWFMRKEIFEQPRAVADSLLGRRNSEGLLHLDEMRLSDDEIRDIDKIIIIACGTSFYAGMVAKYAIEHWTRMPVEVELASEFRYRDPILDYSTLVVAISQSGETADTLQAIRHARTQRSKVLAICNTNGSTIPRESDAVIYTHAGPEIGVASTKGFLTQLVACYLLALYVAQVKGTRYGDEIDADHAPARGDARPHRDGAGARRADLRAGPRSVDTRSVLFLGRHAGYPVALEGALKLKELAYIHAEGFAAGELKHGPIALIEDGLPVFCVVPPRGRDQLHEQDDQRHPGGARPRRAHHLPGRGGRRRDRAVRRPPDPAAAGAGAAAAAGGDRAAAAVRLRAGHRAGPRRRPAAQPRQVRDGRVAVMAVIGVGIDVVDIERFARLDRADARASRDRLFTPAEATRPLASLAARFAAKEALAKALGAPHGDVVARRRGGLRGRPAARCSASAAPCRPAPTSSASAIVHLSLSHDAGIASAVVVLES